MYKLLTRFLHHEVMQIHSRRNPSSWILLTYTDYENDLSLTQSGVCILQVRIKPLLAGLWVDSHVVAIIRIMVWVLLWLTILLWVSTMLATITLLVHALLHVWIHLVSSVHRMVIRHHLLRRKIEQKRLKM